MNRKEIEDFGRAYGFIVGEQRLDFGCERCLTQAIKDFKMGIINSLDLIGEFGYWVY